MQGGKENRLTWADKARRTVPLLMWAALILLCFLHREEITVDMILQYTPRNPWTAALVMLLLFAVKGMSVFIFGGILYAADGILFPLPAAVALNLFGSAIMISLPYWIGRNMGGQALDRLREKHPRLERLRELRLDSDFLFSFVVRAIGMLPADLVSMYMGMVRIRYWPYLLGGLLGLLPAMITFPIMGMNITDVSSPAFLISLGVELAVMAVSTAGCLFFRKRREKKSAA